MSEQAGQLHRPEVWSGVAAGYDDAIAPIMRPYAITTLDLLGPAGGAARVRLLDVAAGTGVVAMEAARRGAEVLATDFAPGMVQVMRRRFSAEGLDARAAVMDGQALGRDDESFDLGTSTFGLIFFPGPLAGLRELRRVLRPGGRVGIASWDMTRVGLPQHAATVGAEGVRCIEAPRQRDQSPVDGIRHVAGVLDDLSWSGRPSSRSDEYVPSGHESTPRYGAEQCRSATRKQDGKGSLCPFFTGGSFASALRHWPHRLGRSGERMW